MIEEFNVDSKAERDHSIRNQKQKV